MRLFVWLALLLPVSAQDLPPSVPVSLGGKEILIVRAPVGAYSPAQRAEEITRRLEKFAADTSIPLESLKWQTHPDARILEAGGAGLLALTEQDVRLSGLARSLLERVTEDRIREAVLLYRQDQKRESIILHIVEAFAAFLAFLVFAWVLIRVYRLLRSLIERFLHAIAQRRPGIATVLVRPAFGLALILLRLTIILVLLALLSAFLTFAFSLFPQTRGISVTLMGTILSGFHAVAAAFVDYLPNLGVLIALCFVAYGLMRFSRAIFLGLERGDIHLDGFHRDWATPTHRLTTVLVGLFALVVGYPYLPGGQSPALQGVGIFVGLLISLGSGSAVANGVSGIILTYMRPFKIGDRVKIGDNIGDIVEKGILITRIRTIKNVEVTLPNGVVLGSPILNYSTQAQDMGLILNTTITIGYDAPWQRVHELLIDAGLHTKHVLADPKPFVFQTSLNDFHISYEINVYTREANRMAEIYADLHAQIQESFNRGGVEIMSPTFLALRDGNTVTTPEAHRPPGYVRPGFKMDMPS